jgi:chromosome segregation ATPase
VGKLAAINLLMISKSYRAVKKNLFCAGVALSALGLCVNLALAQAPAPARSDKIMTVDELRTCMTLEQANKRSAAEILQAQSAFKRDQDVIVAEQTEVDLANASARARSTAIVAERDAITVLVNAHNTKAQAAKTDADKAEVDAERAKITERNAALTQSIASFNVAQKALQDRISALNERIAPINERNRTINDRVAPHQQQAAQWRDQCANRRFREEEEVVVKKELAAGK